MACSTPFPRSCVFGFGCRVQDDGIRLIGHVPTNDQNYADLHTSTVWAPRPLLCGVIGCRKHPLLDAEVPGVPAGDIIGLPGRGFSPRRCRACRRLLQRGRGRGPCQRPLRRRPSGRIGSAGEPTGISPGVFNEARGELFWPGQGRFARALAQCTLLLRK